MNSYQQVKNQTKSSFCFRDIIDLKPLQSDRPRAFQPISQEPNISQILDLYRNIVNNVNFYNRRKSEKNYDQIFQ